MVISDEDSGLQNNEGARIITIRPGHSRSSTIRNFYAAMDRFYASGPDVDVPSEGGEVNESPDVRTDIRVGSSSDAGETNIEPEGTTDHRGSSDTPTELGGGSTDERASNVTDNSPVQASGPDVVETPDERVEQESESSDREQIYPGFHFAPSQHSRGDNFY